MIVPGLYPYTDYTNYTDYTPYTRYTINPGKTTGNRNPGVADPKNLQTNPAHDAGPTVYSCGIRGIRAALGRVLHKEKRTHHF